MKLASATTCRRATLLFFVYCECSLLIATRNRRRNRIQLYFSQVRIDVEADVKKFEFWAPSVGRKTLLVLDGRLGLKNAEGEFISYKLGENGYDLGTLTDVLHARFTHYSEKFSFEIEYTGVRYTCHVDGFMRIRKKLPYAGVMFGFPVSV